MITWPWFQATRIATPRAANMTEKRQAILKDLGFGLLVAVALIFAKEWIDQNTLTGQQLELATYELLQQRLASQEPDAQLPLVIVDLSDLKPQAVEGGQRREEATPREPLETLLKDLLVRGGAYAVGVDVDFSPLQDGRLPVTPRDYDFFDFCLDPKNTENKRVYLGVYRTVLEPREKWLGPDKYKELGASILAPRFDVTKMVNCVAVAGVKECEQDTLAALLAGEMRKLMEPAEEPLVARFPGIFERFSEQRISKGVSVGLFPVDYSQLKTLMSREHTFPSVKPEVMAEFGNYFRNKIVLLGDVNPETSTDKFIVPGQKEPIPGVYIHASAIYTLSQAPLYEFNKWGGRLVDLLLALAVVGAIGTIRWCYSGRDHVEVAHHRLEGILVILVVILSIVIAVGLVHVHRVLWTDFVLAIFALLLHPAGERYTKGLTKWLGQAAPKAWRRTALEENGGGHSR